MNKEEKIKEAWINVQSHIHSEGVPHYNEDGWARYGSKQKSVWFETLEEKQWLGYFFYRPKSLSGIENNNGWIKIESESDLPKEKGYFLCIYKDGEIIPHHFSINSEFDRDLFIEEFTHYQPITKPEPPIF